MFFCLIGHLLFGFQDFQEGVGAPIFLLTSQVGGLGLTLTRADRVIVVDPAWNPRCVLKHFKFVINIQKEVTLLVFSNLETVIHLIVLCYVSK